MELCGIAKMLNVNANSQVFLLFTFTFFVKYQSGNGVYMLLGNLTSIQKSASSATKIIGNLASKVAPSYGSEINSATGAITSAINNPLGAVDGLTGGLITQGKSALKDGISSLTGSISSGLSDVGSSLGLDPSKFDLGGSLGSSLSGFLDDGIFGGSSESLGGPPNMSPAQTYTRLRLRAQTGAENQVYGPSGEGSGNILSILYETNGFLFPFTPTIEWSQSVEYSAVSLVHSNQDYHSYKNTPSTSLTVSGELVIQNYRDARYMLAVIHFLRVVSKMYFGKAEANYPAGMPPPTLTLSGYGNYMFNDLPVIVKNHSFSLGKDVDYVDLNIYGGVVRLPVMLNISLNLVVQNTPKKQREEFNLDKFRTGALMKSAKGWI